MTSKQDRAQDLVKNFVVKTLTEDQVSPEHLISALLGMAAVVARSNDLADEFLDQIDDMAEVFSS